MKGGSGIIIYIACQGMDKRPDKNKQLAKRVEDIKYCRALREFLRTFKTTPCPLNEEHRIQFCHHYHSPKDRRRNPYNGAGFLYYLEHQCNCDNQLCPGYHSDNEYLYHPLFYKTSLCSRMPCEASTQVCWMLHKGQASHFDQGQFFRFDIATFKTIRCTRTDPHDRKVCLYYHYDKDRRRNNFESYSHILCSKVNCNCERSHNKIEQLYHPTRYKTKFCQHYGKDPSNCEYRDFCSFAHSQDEILIQLYDSDNKDSAYMINNYKTIWCPFTLDHDRGECPYAHNIQDYRRKPSVYQYDPIKCDKWDFSNKIESIEASQCPQGMNCTKCHGWMQHRFHPLIYRPKSNPKGYIRKEEPEKKTKPSREKNVQEGLVKRDVSKQKDLEKTKDNKAIYSVGAPFFKNQRETKRQSSIASNKTKPKSGQNSNIEDQKNPFNLPEVTRKPHKISSVYFECEEHQLWACESVENSKERNSDVRSRSQGNSSQLEPNYSGSIKDMLDDPIILSKLQAKKVNQNLLVSMGETSSQLTFLEPREREKLLRKMREYHLYKTVLKYSSKLTNFFAVNEAESILSKLRLKKLTQERILKLNKQSIQELKFLSEQERERLPRLLKKYSQGKEFDNLLNDVEEYISNPT